MPVSTFHTKLLAAILTVFLFPVFTNGQTKTAHASNHNSYTATYNGHSFDVFSVSYPSEKVQMFWKNKHNQKLTSLGRLRSFVESEGHHLLFATNAGMYMEDNSPLGLYIENGRQYQKINLGHSHSGNFYMQPNGIFIITKDKATIIPSKDYKALKEKVLFATQSGPMLVIDGTINSNFTNGSANINIRSGVGITSDGAIVFAISDGFVNFYDFAMMFKTTLKCNNALFLDGSISQMYLPELKRFDTGGNFGAMIGVMK